MFMVEVIADDSGKFVGNGLTFPTVEASEAYARDLWSRWTLVREWRVVKIVVSWGGVTFRIPMPKLEVAR